MGKYYVKREKNEIGDEVVITPKMGTPLCPEDYIEVVLPENGGYLRVRGREKEYPDYKVAGAVAYGHIKIEDVYVVAPPVTGRRRYENEYKY